MFRIESQLCEVFDCTNQQLETRGILDKFNTWLQDHPELMTSSNPLYGEMVNSDIAIKFHQEYLTATSS